MPSNHLILCRPLLFPPSVFPSIRVFSKESVLFIRWPKYWSFSFSIAPSTKYWELIALGWTHWISLQSKGLSKVFFNTKVQKHQFFSAQLSLWSNSRKGLRILQTWAQILAQSTCKKRVTEMDSLHGSSIPFSCKIRITASLSPGCFEHSLT